MSFIFFTEKRKVVKIYFFGDIFFLLFTITLQRTGPILAVYCVQQSHAVIFPFSKYFQILYTFAQIFKYFAVFYPFIIIFIFFCTFEKSHACPYFLEQTLEKEFQETLGRGWLMFWCQSGNRQPTLIYQNFRL